MLSRPIYGRFELDFPNRSKVKVVYADTDANNGFNEDVVDKYEKALIQSNAAGTKIKAILIVNPNNPLGSLPTDVIPFSLLTATQGNATHEKQ